MDLSKQKCIPCEGGVPPLQGIELEKYKKQLGTEAPGWEMKGAKRLEKTFKFKDFKTALTFVNEAGATSEAEGHHPNFELGWGFVRVLIWTHAINGLSQADFALAAKIDQLTRA